MGVTTVWASRNALVTHASRLSPPRSETMVGSAVATIVWSSAASSNTSIRPAKRGMVTMCERSAMFGGPGGNFMRQVATGTAVRIVACTGIYTYDYLPHALVNRDADHMAALFVGDIEHGIQGTEIRAAFLKC